MKLIIAGGGTGGHIYPALAIAQALIEKNQTSSVLFIGTDQGLEKKILALTKFPLLLIKSGQMNIQGQKIKKLFSLVKIPIGIFQSLIILLKHRPDFVLGVGGYASGPMMLAAVLLSKFSKFQIAFWEPNAHPGMANRLISKHVEKSYLVFSEAQKHLGSKKNLVLGMPLRSEIEKMTSLKPALKTFFTILCFGGSQGSQFLNDQLSQFIIDHPDLQNKIKIIHQTGPKDFQRIKDRYQNLENVEVFDYIYNMPEYYLKSDLLFCRGGASTLAEAAVYGLVPIIIPIPAADSHQERNAEALVSQNAGFMILQKDFNQNDFFNIINKLMNDPQLLNQMSQQLKTIVKIGAANRIAEDILQSVKDKKS